MRIGLTYSELLLLLLNNNVKWSTVWHASLFKIQCRYMIICYYFEQSTIWWWHNFDMSIKYDMCNYLCSTSAFIATILGHNQQVRIADMVCTKSICTKSIWLICFAFALLCVALLLLCFALRCFALLCFALLCFALRCFAFALPLLCFAMLCFCFALLGFASVENPLGKPS